MKEKNNQIIRQIRTKKSAFWGKKGAENIINLFNLTSKKVPAYKDFLNKHKVKTEKIKTLADFKSLPPVNKKEYLRRYPLNELTIDGSINKPLVFTSTSGSTGEPFYFHRSFEVDWQTSIIHELFYLQGNYKKDEPVLVIVCFGMGVWIGGVITYQAFRSTQEKGHNVSIITPGINKKEIFNALRSLGDNYKNIIIAGYPPFIKDIIDEGPNNGINWNKFRVRLIFAAEVFTEKFRDYISRSANIKNPLLDTMNIYGTAELGAMAFESPLSILIRRLCNKNPDLFQGLFNGIKKTPTLCQYIPSFFLFENDNDNLLLSGNNTIPLVRYALGDHGGAYSFKEMIEVLKIFNINVENEAKKAGIEKHFYELPFVYVYERSDFSTNLYGLQVYPEPVREALLKKPLSVYLTGKFTLETKFDSKQNQYLLIHLETRKSHNGTMPELIKKLAVKSIVEQIELKNSEYRELHKFLGNRALPRLQFWPYEDPKYFKPGVKQRWIKK